jgi:hypothetical protein
MDKLNVISGYFNLFVGSFLLMVGFGIIKTAKTEDGTRKFHKVRLFAIIIGIVTVF